MGKLTLKNSLSSVKYIMENDTMNQIKKIEVLSIIFCLIIVHMVNGQVDVKKAGQSTMKFLNVSVAAQAAGMGDAYLNVGQGAVSMFYNPAALTELKGKYDLFLSTTSWLADINYYSGSVAYNAGNLGTFAASILFVDYGVINGTEIGAYSDVTGANYTEIGEVPNVGAYAFGIGYARQISTPFSMGGNVMYVGHQLGTHPNQTIGDQQSNKLIFNFGIKYYPGLFKSFRFGMNIRNFGTHAKYEYRAAQMPISFAIGGAVDLLEILTSDSDSEKNRLTVSTQFEHPNDYTERLHIGGEYMFAGMIMLRVGYKFNYDLESFSGGVGFSKNFGGHNIKIDYSYSQIDMLVNVQRVSLSYSL